MAEIDPTQFAGFPYYDDYSDAKKFIKMLFKPGYALQARELTQLQTVLQKQISRFANHVFKDGSPVVDGQLALIDSNFIRVYTTITGTETTDQVAVDPTKFIGKVIANTGGVSGSPQLKMKVLHAEASIAANTDLDADGTNDGLYPDNYHVLFVEYLNTATVINPSTGELQNVSTLQDLYELVTGAGKVLTVYSVVDDTNQEVATDIRCRIKNFGEDVDGVGTEAEVERAIATFGKAQLISNRDGIYYVDGAFVLASSQTKALYRSARLGSTVFGGDWQGTDAVEAEWSSAPGPDSNSIGWTFVTGSDSTVLNALTGVRLFQYPSVRVGFTINREVINADDDKTLLDPAYGSYNYAAPGADRYKVDLILDQIPFTNLDSLSDSDQYKTENFIELTRVVDGVVRYSVKYPVYSELEETLARRTYDESGSYTVKPFEVDIQEYFNDEKVCILRLNPDKLLTVNQQETPFSIYKQYVGIDTVQYTVSSPGGAGSQNSYAQDLSVYGYRGGALAWKGIVSDSDAFLARQGEVDFKEEGYGTTLLYVLWGTPAEGDIIVSESVSQSGGLAFYTSEIPTVEDVEPSLYTVITPAEGSTPRTVLPQQGGSKVLYKTQFPHVGTYTDSRFAGKYSLGRLHPEWASANPQQDPTSEEIRAAVNDAKSKLSIGVGTGKAYIYGYEFDNQNTKYLTVDKARDTESSVGETVQFAIGNYVICQAPITGDVTGPDSLVLPSWSSLPKVELWNTLRPDGLEPNDPITGPGNVLIGTARVRGVTNTGESDNINVFLCDVDVIPGRYFTDFDQIRYRYANVEDTVITGDEMGGSIELFNISLTGGPAGTGGTIKYEVIDPVTNQPPSETPIYYYDTILFAPKANIALFDLPTLCSVKGIDAFATTQYDCKKTFANTLSIAGDGTAALNTPGLTWKNYGALVVLCNTTTLPGVVANAQSTNTASENKTLYTFNRGTTTSLSSQLSTALGAGTYYDVSVDTLNDLLIFNTNTNQYIPPSDIQAATSSDGKTLYVIYQGAAPTGIFSLEAPVRCQSVGTGVTTTNFRKKTATTVNEYQYKEEWEKYFDSDGYFRVPLQNWDGLFAQNNSTSFDPFNVEDGFSEGTNVWNDWTGDDDDTNNQNGFNGSSLPEQYITSLGFSDIISVDEVLAWDNTVNDTTGMVHNGKRDITAYFESISGATDNFYDHGKIVISKATLRKLKTELPNLFRNSGGFVDYTLFVRFKFFKHSGSGPFTINSYTHEDHHPFFNEYEDIPLYTSPVYGSTYELRNCIDYRPSRENCTPARVAYAIAESVETVDPTIPGTTNRPHALDTDCPFRDNSLIAESNGNMVPAAQRGDSATVLPRLGASGIRPTITYQFYTSRRDKLVLLKNRTFDIVSGIPSIRPESPKDVPESMSLYNILLPQYTFGPEDVTVDYIDNKRYTMSDIAKLEKRIERVEYYTTLTLLEKEAAELSIPDPALGGAERIKNGIFVDNFKGHGVGNVFSPYYSCSMDFANGHLRPRFATKNVAFVPNLTGNTNFSVSPDGVVTLAYDDSAPNRYIVQPLASRAISVNPFDVVSWLGTVNLAPSSDTWVDTNTRPAVNINLEGENDAWLGMENAFGTQWNDWETTWSGVRASTTETLAEKTSSRFLDAPHSRRAPDGVMRRRKEVTTTRTNLVTETIDRKQTREGVKLTITPQRVTKELGDRIVDVSVIPFIRERTITIVGKGLKPNTVLYAFFDNTLVNKYCYDSVGNAITPSNPIRTNSAGEIEIEFRLPGGVFKTGERQFRLTDDPTNDLSKSNTSGDASYFAQGLLQTKENTIVSTRVPKITRQTVTEDRVVRDVVTRVQTDSTSSIRWADPLAQTFLVDVAKNPNGVWLHSVDLFFKNKPTGESAPPVRVQIRPTVNGYPHSSAILPFAEVLMNAEDVSITEALASDGSDAPNINNQATYTRFKFSSPVYLIPGEYSIVVMSNSNEYECYIAEMGETALGAGGARITQQPYAGVFFKSQNASTWSADQNADLMFALNTCVFKTTTEPLQIVFNPVSGVEGFTTGETFETDNAKIISQLLKFETGTVTAYVKETATSAEIVVPLNENFSFRPRAVTMSANSKLVMEFTNTDATLSPCVDSERLSMICIDNIIGNPDAIDNYTEEFSARPLYEVDDPARPVSRYISRRVDLNSGLECDDLKVYLSANLPNYEIVGVDGGVVKTKVEVWAKIQTPDSDVPFDDLNWMKMEMNPLQVNQTATDEVTFSEYSFSLPEVYYPGAPSTIPSTGYTKLYQQFATPFARYAIKIVLYSNTGTVVPKVKDLRVIGVV